MHNCKPFIVLGLFIKAEAWPKEEKNPVCEDESSNISLELSLSSLDYTSTTATATDEGNQEIHEGNIELGESSIDQYYQRKENNMENVVEKKSDGVSSDSSLSHSGDYDLGSLKNFDIGECRNQYQREEEMEEHNLNNRQGPNVEYLSLELSLGSGYNCTSTKRKRMENPSGRGKVSSWRNMRTKVQREEIRHDAVDTELRLGPADPWCIRKQLFASDLGNNSRLLLPLELVESHVFPHWNNDQLGRITQGVPVSVWDCNTNTRHDMVFQQWNKGANVLKANWVKEFVKRRELKVGDEIGLYWDIDNSRFIFSVLKRAPRD
ncbi:hypothetical protein DITRI_Ditri18aG0122900 [Diplodiscus trichospermus]